MTPVDFGTTTRDRHRPRHRASSFRSRGARDLEGGRLRGSVHVPATQAGGAGTSSTTSWLIQSEPAIVGIFGAGGRDPVLLPGPVPSNAPVISLARNLAHGDRRTGRAPTAARRGADELGREAALRRPRAGSALPLVTVAGSSRGLAGLAGGMADHPVHRPQPRYRTRSGDRRRDAGRRRLTDLSPRGRWLRPPPSSRCRSVPPAAHSRSIASGVSGSRRRRPKRAARSLGRQRLDPAPQQRLALGVHEHVGPPQRVLDELEPLRGDRPGA